MKFLEHRFTLDIRQDASRVCVLAKKGDTARKLRILLTNGIVPYEIAPDCYAVFSAIKPDGNRLFNPCVIEDNRIVYELTPQTTAVEGQMECEIRLYGADDMLITSPGFDMIVDDVLYDENQVPQSETEVDALTGLISDAAEVIAEGRELIGDYGSALTQIEGVRDEAEAAARTAEDSRDAAASSEKNAQAAASTAANAAKAAEQANAEFDQKLAAAEAALEAANEATAKAEEAISSVQEDREAAENAAEQAKQHAESVNTQLAEDLQQQIDDLKENGTGGAPGRSIYAANVIAGDATELSVNRNDVESVGLLAAPGDNLLTKDGKIFTVNTVSIKDLFTDNPQYIYHATLFTTLSGNNASDSSQNGDGLTSTEKTLILSLFKNTAYTADMSTTIAQLEALWSNGNEEEPEEPVDPEVTLTSISATYAGGEVAAGTAVDNLTGIVVTAHYSDGSTRTVTGYTLTGTIGEGENTVTVTYQGMTTTFTVTGVVMAQTYTVTNNLTNVTNSNTATTATGFYSATLSAEDGYTISVTVTMGGVDITNSVYTEDGTILIPDITGDIVITATAELATSPVLYQLANTPRTVNADLYEDTGLAFGSSSANGYTKAWTICADAVVTTNQKGLYGVNNAENAHCLYFQTNGAGTGQIYICNNSNVTSPANAENRHRFVITHVASENKKATIHLATDGKVVSTEVAGSYANFAHSAYAGNLHIGGKTSAAFIGVINEFTIYEGVQSAAHIAEFLGVE